MNDAFEIQPNGLLLPSRKLIVPKMFHPCPALEEFFPFMDKAGRIAVGDRLLHDARAIKEGFDKIWHLAGSLAFQSSKAIQDLIFSATAFGLTNTTLYFALYTAAIDDTLLGNTANESAYTSYARLGLTNNATIFAAGTGTTTYTKTFPSDATKSWVTSTGGTSTVTYMGILNGNAGTSADKGYAWCTVTSTVINSGDTPQLAQNAVTVVQD
jgi:hypothetical protein